MVTRNRIRVVLMLNSFTTDHWESACIEKMLCADFCEVVGVITRHNEERAISGVDKWINYPFSKLLWRVWKRFIVKPKSQAQIDLHALLSEFPEIKCQVIRKGKYREIISESDLERIRELQPDVIVRFGFNILSGDILTVAKHGIWSFHHGDERVFRGGPPGFWEIYYNKNTTGIILQQLNEKLDNGIIIERASFSTQHHSYSAQLDHIFYGGIDLLIANLRRLQSGALNTQQQHVNTSPAPIYTYAGNFKMKLFLLRLFKNKIAFHVKSLFQPEDWCVGIVPRGIKDVMKNGWPESIQWLSPTKNGEYYADPMILNHQVIAEHYSYNNQKGIIAEIHPSYQPIITTDHHLSYPFILSNGRRSSVIPECGTTGKIRAYNTDGSFYKTLIDFPGIDPTIIHHENKWWLFCTEGGEYSNSKLFLFYADDSFGPYTAHPCNPIKTDHHSARSAGPLFYNNGQLIRPAQDCSEGYGSGIRFMKVTKLTPQEFAEEELSSIYPNSKWTYNSGCHTIAQFNDNQCVIDAKRYRFNFDNFTAILQLKLKRLFHAH
jgi:folate-dependent phosphoribosylglycinamide formyltransferase PurN